MFLGHSFGFWVAVAGAILVKVITSDSHNIWRVGAMFICALFSAWAFTKPTMTYWELDAEKYEILVAATWALTGEGIMRSLISVTSSPEKMLDFIKSMWGKK